jgi:hypothetical protein
LKRPFVNSNSHLHKEKEMLDFRKSFLLLALLTVMAVGVSAQAINCSITSGIPPVLRSESYADESGQIIITCTGGTTLTAGVVPQITISVYLNVNITSRLLADPWTEALLLIDEPAAGAQVVCGATGTGWDASSRTCPLNLTTPPTTAPNVWQGLRIADNGISFLGVPLNPPGTTATRTYRIVNIRANATQIASQQTGLIPVPLTAFVQVAGPVAQQSVSVSGQTQTVGYVASGFSVSTRTADGASARTTPLNILQCAPQNTDAPASTKGCVDLRVRFEEGSVFAFKPRGSSGSGSTTQATPGTLYGTESMFVNPAFPDLTGIAGGSRGVLSNAGVANQNTRLAVRFSNVPAGVRIFATLGGVAGATSASLTTSMVGSGTSTTTTSSAGSTIATCTNAAGVATGIASTSYAEISIDSTGVGTAWYQVSAADAASFETLDIGILIRTTVSSGLTTSAAPVTVTGGFGPTDTTATMSADARVPRFVSPAKTNTNVFAINTCVSNLLFPYVTNSGQFDTGLAVSNTSADPFGTVAQQGTCTVRFYGETAGGGAAPPAQTTTIPVAAGKTMAFNLTGGNATYGITPLSSAFTGYVIATCNFQFAHGFAFVSDVGARNVAMGYLALVMDGAIGSRSGSTSESLNQ